MTEEEYKESVEVFRDAAKDYIPLTFKGQHYSSAILFVEILLEELKDSQKKSDSPIIKDILGR